MRIIIRVSGVRVPSSGIVSAGVGPQGALPIDVVRNEPVRTAGARKIGETIGEVAKGGAGGHLLPDRLHHVGDIAPESAEPVTIGDVTVAHDDVGEVELGMGPCYLRPF